MDSDTYEKNRLRKLIEETLREHGVSFNDTIVDSPARHAYLRLLAAHGQQEDDVLPMMDLTRITPETYRQSFAILVRELERTRGKLDKSFSMLMINSVQEVSNTNSLIDTISSLLQEQLKSLGIDFPSFYAAVYPTPTYNGETRRFHGHNLVLLHTGLIETLEFVVVALIAKIEKVHKTALIRKAVFALANGGLLPRDELIPTDDGIDWGSLPTATFLNGAESFILLHEIGHLILDHVEENSISRKRTRSRRELKQAWIREYAADAWAFDALSRLGSKIRHRVDPEERQLMNMFSYFGGNVGSRFAKNIELFGGLGLNSSRKQKQYLEWMSGPTIAFGLGTLVEKAYLDERNHPAAEHPPAMARLRKLYGERFSMVDQLVAPEAREFLSIVNEIGGGIAPSHGERTGWLKSLLPRWIRAAQLHNF
jgi:hypothetical protein